MSEVQQPFFAEEMMSEILKHSFDAIAVSDAHGIMQFFSDSYERITGQKGERYIGKKVSGLRAAGMAEAAIFEHVAQTSKPTTMAVNYPVSGKRALVTAAPVLNSDGECCAIVANIRDMDELNDLHQELNRTRKRNEKPEQGGELLRIEVEQKPFVAKSAVMRDLIELAHRLAVVDSNVLITGESGVGKDMYARMIHNFSPEKKDKPFITLNMTGMPENLIESVLFGYEAGMFTGAKKDGHRGLLEIAEDGTVFLNEIGDMPLQLQAKLLNVLQDRRFVPVGSPKRKHLRARVITATNRDLKKAVAEGKFREDLYYRINVIPVEIPPLRERRDDIAAVAEELIRRMNEKGKTNKVLSDDVLYCLERYSWPGNTRELANVIERMVVLSFDNNITTRELPHEIRAASAFGGNPQSAAELSLHDYLEEMEKYRISLALDKPQSFAEAANELGIDKSTLTRKVQKYKLSRRYSLKYSHEDI